MNDFPKLQCPFVRKLFKIDEEDWKKYGNEFQLRKPEVYLVIDEVNPGYEWVFDDPETIAVEKLHGTNILLITKNGRLLLIKNRKQIIDPLEIMKGKTHIYEGVFNAMGRGYIASEGEVYGELIGTNVNSNPYQLNMNLWYPFWKAIKHLRYNCFHEHDRTFDNWSSWFKDYLFSRFFAKRKKDNEPNIFAEGIVLYNFKRKKENKVYMAKLRRDMFDWYYSDKIKILNYSK